MSIFKANKQVIDYPPMIKSMTGYGKSECTIASTKYTIEIRSLNSKNADITIKGNIIPREKELEVRSFLAAKLGRGTIDLFISAEAEQEAEAGTINASLVQEYYRQIVKAADGTNMVVTAQIPKDTYLLSTILRMPNVVETKKTALSEEQWQTLFEAIKEAAEALVAFRIREGAILEKDILSRVDLIEGYIPMVEALEADRVNTVRTRILSRIAEIGITADMNRLEQEIIFYIEKFDINEEKVRLRQHCRYFRETAASDSMPGKKLGFIAQEMGREINTLGSKANHAEIQQIVVKMKDELEKIKEQSLNIL